MLHIPNPDDTIVALSTPAGVGAIGVVRVSGSQAIPLVAGLYRGHDLRQAAPNTTHYGRIMDGDVVVDEVVVAVFRAPHSYTREDVVEISCHGSPYILHRVIELLVQAGARPAAAGEFTLRAFRAGALDLSQAEAVADLIAARSASSQRLAMQQLRGGYAQGLKDLRAQLLQFAALIELELDFAEEDVEFANRQQLHNLLLTGSTHIERLVQGFAAGNALKHGIPTVIAGKPNAGKSTLLNRLLDEERAIVSPIAGTTRDVIEDRLVIEGYEFRLMDTAGIRGTQDAVEAQGVQRTLLKLEQALMVLLLFDASTESEADAASYAQTLPIAADTQLFLVANKTDLAPQQHYEQALPIVASTGQGIAALKQRMATSAAQLSAGQEVLLTNQRHLHALRQVQHHLQQVQQGLASGLSGELLALDLRHALHHLGQITGEVTSDEVLGSIFSQFCIGK